MTRRIAIALAFALVVPALAHAQDSLTVVRGAPPSGLAPAENFTGTVRVGGWFEAEAPARTYGATVAFEVSAAAAESLTSRNESTTGSDSAPRDSHGPLRGSGTRSSSR